MLHTQAQWLSWSFVTEKAAVSQCQCQSSKQTKVSSRYSDPEYPGTSMFSHSVVLIFISDWSSFRDCYHKILSPKSLTGDVQMCLFFIVVFCLVGFFPNPKWSFQSSKSSCRGIKPAWNVPSVYSSLNIGTCYAKLCHCWEENFDHPILNYSSGRHSDRCHNRPRNSTYILCQISTCPHPLNSHSFSTHHCVSQFWWTRTLKPRQHSQHTFAASKLTILATRTIGMCC